ncbi:hypothetical protein BEP19_01900 [Ammoniphilus oxalaticus]|uniref:Lipoprotein n=1 Tax=Ammoniphilus oxalaticus TaxID=66863 RepID=A0A419SNC4_9BACL|nr:hypothetical protein [Ammoniphilus oxalaticus]RKD25719.1 hypothetical protein BEP19_01900 [Ammoniphilus oxalaticus]
MRFFIALLVSILLLSGCGSESSFFPVKEIDVGADIQSFLKSVEQVNGVHLYLNSPKVIYVYLNGAIVKQGEKAVHFIDFDVKENGDTLHILYTSNETDNYSDPSLRHNHLYQVKLKKKYEKIKLFRNGEETHFGVISGK